MNIPEPIRKSVSFTKISQKTPNAHLLGVFDCEDRLTFRLTLPRRLGAKDPILDFYRDDDQCNFSLPFRWKGSDYVSEQYECVLTTASLCKSGEKDALLWYSVLMDSGYGRLRLSMNPYSYAPVLADANEYHSDYQLTVCKAGYDAPHAIRGGIMYHIFVDRFAQGGEVPVREDAILNPDWDNGVPQYADYRGGYVENNMFFGGTLYGIIDKLDYLESLGVSILYLSPIFRAYSNHKYDTGDYLTVDEMFGGDEALEKLIAETKKRNIAILLDGVFNHTGADSLYFNKKGRYDSVGAYQSKDSPYYDWYEFRDYPDSYRCWWDIDILPAVTTTNPSYLEFMTGEKGVVRHYLKKGISGWRLDVADELDSLFLDRLRTAVKAENPEAMIYGEVWEDASDKVAYGTRRKYFRGDQLDSVMNYPLKDGIIRFVKYGDKNALFAATALLYAHYPKGTSDTLMNHLGTHDTERILTVLGGDPDGGRTAKELSVARMSLEQRANAKALLKLCYTLSATLPGIPCIYYGDEAGMEGYRDPFNRMPYPWNHQDADLLAFYRKLGTVRRSLPVFAEGWFEVDESTPDGVFAFTRFDGDCQVYVAVNRSEEVFPIRKKGREMLTDSDGECYLLEPGTSAILLLQKKKNEKNSR
ncbi:MAG: glycoside hydrolase family 13 protein [Eubacteriales bacterium]